MDDNESTGAKSGVNDTIRDAEPPKHATEHGQATIPRGPLQSGPDSSAMATGMFVEMAHISTTAEGSSSPSNPPAASNSTVVGAPIEEALRSSGSFPPQKLPATVVQTSVGAPASAIVKTVTDVPPGITSSPSIAPPPSHKKPSQGIPVLPIALGAGALVMGIALFAIVWGSSKGTKEEAPSVPVPTVNAADSLNAWIRVEGAPGKVIGVSDNDVPPSVRGFRPAHQVLAASAPFEIQQHEVTWAELDPWLEKNPAHSFPKATTGLTSADAHKSLPAYGVPWTTALEYCRSIRGTLPTEEQWELAARSASMKKFPWGNAAPDWSKVHAFKGEMAGPAKVMSSEQDRTEGAPDKAIHDLAGNVQEWTFSVWREDTPDMDESWVQAQGTTAYAVRGFPLHRDAPGRSDELTIAHRDWVCATGDCSPLSSGASPKERARTPKLELWANADSTQPGALEWRRVIEKPAVMAAVTKCFSGATATTLTVKASRESFCKRPEHVPSNSTCEGSPALLGALAKVSGGLPETTLKCVNYALHDASATNIGLNLPETQFSYAAYVSTDPREALRHIGFRCVREAAKR